MIIPASYLVMDLLQNMNEDVYMRLVSAVFYDVYVNLKKLCD
jgi:hypothetical protein